MKSFGMLPVVVVMMVSGWITSYSQGTEPEVPGDHFSLEGALELFKKSASPEEFEKMLNSPDSKVNNLDLNGDGYIDYIRVFDRYEGNIHAFIIQAVVSDSENQDVAVIELEKLGNGKAVLQIIGDEDIYGVETIIEPTREVRTYAGSMSAPTVVNVWAWPSVQYVYSPYYSGWYSPWGWHMRPVWWHRWRPIAYVHYHSYWRPYRPYYAVCHTHRVVYAHRIYRPYRTTSVIVHNRHHAQVTRYRSAHRDGDNGRTRNDEARNSRSSTRGSEYQRGEGTNGNRRYSERETVTSDRSRNSTGIRSNELRSRESIVPSNNRDARSQVTTTPGSTSRSIRSGTRLESTTTERSIPADFNRSTSEIRRTDSRNRSTVTAPSRETRQQVTRLPESRGRTTASPGIQQRSPVKRESAQTNFQRNSSGMNRNDSRNRSTVTTPSRETRPQVNRSVESKSRSSVSPNVQRPSNRTGGTQSGGTKRGRH